MEELLLAFRRGHLQRVLGKVAPTRAQRTKLESPNLASGWFLQGMIIPGWGLRARSEVRNWQSPPGLSTVLTSLFGWEQALKAHTASR